MEKITPIAGLLTCFVLYTVIIIAALPYEGQQGEAYSIFNHFISELGSMRFSTNHAIYNGGLMLASVGFGLFTFGLKDYFSTKSAQIGVRIGVLSSILSLCVGLVPEDYRIPHLLLAVSFFSMMALAAGIISWNIWVEERRPFPKWVAMHGFLIPITFVLFMSMPKHLMEVKRAQGAAFDRPEIWWLPFLEWIIFVLLTSWIFIVSIQMFQMYRKQTLLDQPALNDTHGAY